MTAIARLEVIPNRGGSISDAIAVAIDALDEFDVSYEMTPTDTVLEADDVGELFAAAEAAHRAVPDERLVTSLEIDEARNRRQTGRERITSVERELGRPAKRERPTAQSGVRQAGRGGQRGEAGQHGGAGQRSESRQAGETTRPGESGQRGEISQSEKPKAEVRRYHGLVRSQEASDRPSESGQQGSRYLRAGRQR